MNFVRIDSFSQGNINTGHGSIDSDIIYDVGQRFLILKKKSNHRTMKPHFQSFVCGSLDKNRVIVDERVRLDSIYSGNR